MELSGALALWISLLPHERTEKNATAIRIACQGFDHAMKINGQKLGHVPGGLHPGR